MGGIRGIRLVGILAFAAFAALLATWYITFTSERERYLTSRNFRILTTIAAQVDSSIAAQERMFRTFLAPGASSAKDSRDWFSLARESVPSLAFVDESRLPSGYPTGTSGRLTSDSQVVMEGRAVSLRVSVRPSATQPVTTGDEGTRDVWLTLGSLLAPIFRPKLKDGAFDTLVLATPDGRVLHAVGDRSSELALTNLSALEPVGRTRFGFGASQQASTPPRTFKTVAPTTGIVDLVIAGTEYKLFTQPCCLTTTLGSGASGTPSAQATAGLVIVGLVPASEFRTKAREIPPTVVMVCIALILVSLAAWPFLKLRLMGERHRLPRLDVIEVVACGTFAIALLTLVFLDIYAYRQLTETRDRQLRDLAGDLSQHVRLELAAAREQLRDLQDVAKRIDPNNRCPIRKEIFKGLADVAASETVATERPTIEHAVDPCEHSDVDFRPNPQAAGAAVLPPAPKYPLFETFALIDAAGKQSVKWTSGKWLPDRIPVANRPYFTEIRAGRAWHNDDDQGQSEPRQGGCDRTGYVLDSIWSWTTSRPEAVVASPTCDSKLPVAALAIPMRSLIDPVLPAGFEFAVINDDGLVAFHSDPQRNTFENFFQETDQDRRLRATVSAHSDETFDLVYAGRSYRAHVDRLNVGDWSVVTLYSNEPAWALHTGWTVLALAALSGYLLVLAAVFGLCLWTRSSDWLWSDPRRVIQYRQLSLVIGVLLVAGSLALYFGRDDVLLLGVPALPLAGWLICYLVLRRPPSDGPAPREAHAEYASLAVLLFLLTSVIPATGFFTAAHRLHARTYVKHAQLKLAQALKERTARLQKDYEDVPGLSPPVLTAVGADEYDLYYRFLFGTTVRFDSEKGSDLPPHGHGAESSDGVFARLVDDYLPYYSDHSVQMRELLHDIAGDGAWRWKGSAPQLELTLYGSGKQSAIHVSSTTPELSQGLIEGGSLELGIWTVLAGMLLAGLAWAFVRFIETHICLLGVNSPLWSRVKLAGSSGDNLFVVCDPPDRAALAEGAFELNFGRIFSSATPDQDWVRKLMELDRTEPGRPVLLVDFDENLDNPELTLKKLAWLEDLASDQTRSVIVLSSASPALLDHTLRARGASGTAGDPRLVERWRAVLGQFVVMNWRGLGDESEQKRGPLLARPRAWQLADAGRRLRSAVEVIWRRDTWMRLRTLPALLAGWSGLRPRDDGAVRKRRSDLAALHAEAEADAFVRAICASIEGRIGNDSLRLSREQVLDEVTERTETWYRRLWKSCSPHEQLVLAEIADDGFVNYKSRRTVRRLLGRGLASKDPSFRLMNETFRRFVQSPPCQADVRAFEGASGPSTLDKLRLPFFVVLIGAALFFMLTQRELFDATIATLTTVTMAVPVLIRFAGMMSGKRDGGEVQKA